MHACVKLADERDAVCKTKAEQEEHTKGMATQVANAEARAVKAETEVGRWKKEQTSRLVAKVYCWKLFLVDDLMPAAMRFVMLMVT